MGSTACRAAGTATGGGVAGAVPAGAVGSVGALLLDGVNRHALSLAPIRGEGGGIGSEADISALHRPLRQHYAL